MTSGITQLKRYSIGFIQISNIRFELRNSIVRTIPKLYFNTNQLSDEKITITY